MLHSVHIDKNEGYEFEVKVTGICAYSEYRVQLKERKFMAMFKKNEKLGN